MTPTQRTLKALRDMGYRADVAEYWQPSFAARQVVEEAQRWATSSSTRGLLRAIASLDRMGPGKRRDLYGWIDVEAHPTRAVISDLGCHVLGVQCTTNENMSARITKLCTDRRDAVLDWLANGHRAEVWGWYKYATAVGGKWWRPTVKRLTLASNGGISVEGE